MLATTNRSIVRLTLVCFEPRCGRRLSIPLPEYERAHGVDCDRCDVPLVLIAAARDHDGAIVWTDRASSGRTSPRASGATAAASV